MIRHIKHRLVTSLNDKAMAFEKRGVTVDEVASLGAEGVALITSYPVSEVQDAETDRREFADGLLGRLNLVKLQAAQIADTRRRVA